MRLSPLMMACVTGHEAAVSFLLEAGAGAVIPKQDAGVDPQTPLMVACTHGQAGCVRRLLAAGQRVDRPEFKAAFHALEVAVAQDKNAHADEDSARACAMLLLEHDPKEGS